MFPVKAPATQIVPVRLQAFILLLLGSLFQTANADYLIQPGDILSISVWNEDRLTLNSAVLPDGSISFPLIGVLNVANQSPRQVKEQLTDKLSTVISDPVVNIEVKEARGNSVYVIGKVNAPGRFVLDKPTDVLQILSMAGGFGTYAKSDEIRILRRNPSGATKVFDFNYEDIIKGKNLNNNIILQAADTVIVP